MSEPKRLSSKNYESYQVFIRSIDQPYMLNPVSGQRLMEYLTGQDINMFVRLNDIDGSEILVRTATIDRIEPVLERGEITQDELKQLMEKL